MQAPSSRRRGPQDNLSLGGSSSLPGGHLSALLPQGGNAYRMFEPVCRGPCGVQFFFAGVGDGLAAGRVVAAWLLAVVLVVAAVPCVVVSQLERRSAAAPEVEINSTKVLHRMLSL